MRRIYYEGLLGLISTTFIVITLTIIGKILNIYDSKTYHFFMGLNVRYFNEFVIRTYMGKDKEE